MNLEGREILKKLLLYRSLWKETGDKFDGAGLLHCFRKLELFNDSTLTNHKINQDQEAYYPSKIN